jgi:hypothetical protein
MSASLTSSSSNIHTPMHEQPLVQTPTISELRRPRLKCNGVANKTCKVLVIQPANRLFVGLDTNGNAIIASTRLSCRFIRVAESASVLHHYSAQGKITYLCHLTYPLLIIRISPCFSVVPCHFSVSAISSIGISCLDTGFGAFPFFSSYHLTQSHSTPRPTIPPFSHQLCVPFVSVVPACSCVKPL